MNTISKAHVSMFLDDKDEPCGLIYFNKNKERVIYLVAKADEEEIITLFEGKNCTSKKQGDHMSSLPLDPILLIKTKNVGGK